MDFRPTDGQRLLQTAARDFLARHCPLEAPPGGEPLHQDRGALWSKLGELGWTGLLVPGDLGGSDGTILDVVLLAEEMGRAGLAGPFVASAVVATSLLLGAGTAAQQARRRRHGAGAPDLRARRARRQRRARARRDGTARGDRRRARRQEAPRRRRGSRRRSDRRRARVGGGDALPRRADPARHRAASPWPRWRASASSR